MAASRKKASLLELRGFCQVQKLHARCRRRQHRRIPTRHQTQLVHRGWGLAIIKSRSRRAVAVAPQVRTNSKLGLRSDQDEWFQVPLAADRGFPERSSQQQLYCEQKPGRVARNHDMMQPSAGRPQAPVGAKDVYSQGWWGTTATLASSCRSASQHAGRICEG